MTTILCHKFNESYHFNGSRDFFGMKDNQLCFLGFASLRFIGFLKMEGKSKSI